MFLAKYDGAGNAVWAQSVADWWSEGGAIATDRTGHVFVTGQYDSSITFGGTVLTVSGQAVFLAEYDTAGNASWANTTGPITGDTWVYSLAADGLGNVYAGGNFAGALQLDSATALSTASGFNILLVEYDSEGHVIWTNTGSEPNTGRILALSPDADGEILAGGVFFSSSLTLGSSTVTVDSPEYGMFFAKLGMTALGLPGLPLASVLEPYPNPAGNYVRWRCGDPSATAVAVYDLLGRKLVELPSATADIPLDGLPNGVYVLRATGGREAYTARFVVDR
jgi:Secretion system C-terminal sorting domain